VKVAEVVLYQCKRPGHINRCLAQASPAQGEAGRMGESYGNDTRARPAEVKEALKKPEGGRDPLGRV
jgi:hypothetical protein